MKAPRRHLMPTPVLFLALAACSSTPEESPAAPIQPRAETPREEPRAEALPVESTASAEEVSTPLAARYAKIGFELIEEDGRLWIFRTGSTELGDFRQQGELAKHVTRPGAGPGGITVKAPDNETIRAYAASKPGFVSILEGERLWVFRVGSPELSEFRQKGELGKHVIRPGAGPLGMTVKAPDRDTADAYLYAKAGFVVIPEDGRLWVFRKGSPALGDYQEYGEPAKHVTRPGAGPDGKTVKAPDSDTILEYMAASEGFETYVREGRIWVFRIGDPEVAEFQRTGEPAEQVIRPLAGPLSMTVKAPDRETMEAYLASVRT